jgi:predicted RND superfamily exporter protein
METIFNGLQRILKRIIQFPATALGCSLILGIIGFLLATNLRIDTDLSELIPEDYPSVQALQKLQEQVGAEHEVAVIIESPSFKANKNFAQALISRALQMRQTNGDPYFIRAEFRKEINFIKENALYFATNKELDKLENYLKQKIDKAKEEANPFYFNLDEEESSELDSLGNELSEMYEELIGAEYPTSPDSTVLAVKLFPSGSQTDLTFVRNTYSDLQTLIEKMHPADFHPNLEVVLAGRLIRTLIEVQTITRDVFNSFGTGVLMLLLFVVLYFQYKSYRANAGDYFSFQLILQQLRHIPAHTLIVALPMVFSLTLTFGIAWLTYQKLTIMTATLGLLLFGMGIDFGIHFFARYTEEREAYAVPDALIKTFMTTGQAIAIVGLTTAAAFFILMLADFKGFSEFGFIAGVGLLLSIVAYIFVLPALLVLLEKFRWLNLSDHPKKTIKDTTSYDKKTRPGRKLVISYIIIAIALITTAVTIVELPNLKFEYDFAELEPEYEEYNILRDEMNKVYSDRKTRNAAYVIVDAPTQAVAVAKQLRDYIATDTLTPTIRSVETFQDRYPVDSTTVQQKLNRIHKIRGLLQDPFIKDSEDPQIEQLQLATSTEYPIALEDVPDFIKDPFTSKTGEIGTLVIIHPSVGLADGRNSMLFADDVGEITIPSGQTFYAGSTSIVASDMLRLMIEETPIMVTLTIIFIIIFKLIVLRKIKWMLLALLPLTASFLWMFGLLEIVGWKLNFYNLVVLPTVLGIGDDSGIHLVHRYLEEGKGSIHKVLSSTGEHITISALTTMLGFGGLLFSIHPGMRSIGEMAVLGIGLTLFAALFLLPALLTVLELKPKNIKT